MITIPLGPRHKDIDYTNASPNSLITCSWCGQSIPHQLSEEEIKNWNNVIRKSHYGPFSFDDIEPESQIVGGSIPAELKGIPLIICDNCGKIISLSNFKLHKE